MSNVMAGVVKVEGGVRVPARQGVDSVLANGTPEVVQWSTPLKSEANVSRSWTNPTMAPIKPERSHASSFAGGKGLASAEADSLQVLKDRICGQDSPLRHCPKFENVTPEALLSNVKERDETGQTIMFSVKAEQLPSKPIHDNVHLGVDYQVQAEKRAENSGDESAELRKEDEDDGVCILGCKYDVINRRCPLSGKLITELKDPVQSVSCRHVYEKALAKKYIDQCVKSGSPRCAAAGCSKFLIVDDLVCDDALRNSIKYVELEDTKEKLELLMQCIHIDDDE